MTAGEKFCKWGLLWLLIFSIFQCVREIISYDLINTTYFYDALLFLIMIATIIQAIIGIISWVKINRYEERAKTWLMVTYGVSGGIYGMYLVVQLLFLVIPGMIFNIYEFIYFFTLFGLSAAVLVLQHFWTRDIL